MAAQEFKLKGISSLDLKPGELREVEVEGIDEAKVLLTNVKGTISAIGPKCTHYGAPLVKGVISQEGNLRCPWHGACFNAKSGDIEDAPALDSLASFKLIEKDGAIYVSGEKDTIKSGRRKPCIKSKSAAPAKDKLVIVGGGSGAQATLESLREYGYAGDITLISSEGYLPIDRTKLSKALIDDPAKIQLRDQEFLSTAGVEVVSDQVSNIDFGSKSIKTEQGKEFTYNKLVLATGGSPKSLPLPGFKDLENVFLLRTIHHTKKINAAIGDGNKKIVIIGSSFIGMEVANAVAKNNDVTVVGMEKAPMERVMGEEVGKIFQSALEGNGVKFYLNAGVDSAVPSDADKSKVGGIKLKDGTTLPADLVILGTGVSPATTFLKDNSAVKLLDDGSLRTDENFSVVDLPDVYAIGDIATYPYHGPGGDGSPIRIEHWNVAQNSGRAAAAHIVDPSTQPKNFIPIFWSALGQQLRYVGNTVGGYDDLILTGEPQEKKFVAYYTKGETVVAVATMGKDPVMVHCAELMRVNKMPTKSELKQGVDILSLSLGA